MVHAKRDALVLLGLLCVIALATRLRSLPPVPVVNTTLAAVTTTPSASPPAATDPKEVYHALKRQFAAEHPGHTIMMLHLTDRSWVTRLRKELTPNDVSATAWRALLDSNAGPAPEGKTKLGHGTYSMFTVSGVGFSDDGREALVYEPGGGTLYVLSRLDKGYAVVNRLQVPAHPR